MKYYTTDGDDGMTGLLGGGRVPKHHPQPEAFGAVDEASAALGAARAVMQDREAAGIVLQAQRDLYHLMAELAATPEAAPRFRRIDAERVAWLEAQTDAYGARIPPFDEFVTPGDSLPGALLDLARAIVRRAERRVVRLRDDGLIANNELIRYLNRLSSLCFVLARHEDALSGAAHPTLAKDG
jgi:cob(I)alamin adenosyltransferase